jgi:two-component system, NtrC family, sensor kinase
MSLANRDGSPPFRILIVEDSLETAEMICYLLEHQGYEVVVLNSGIEALELIDAVERGEGAPFDMALIDVMMPQVNGYQVCERIRQTAKLGYIPIIMVTALSSTEDMVRGLDMGADDYLVKPFDPKDLLARVRAALRVRDADRAVRRHNWQLAVVNAFNDAVGGSLEEDEVLQAALAELLGRLDLVYAAIFLREPYSDHFTRILYNDGTRWLDIEITGPTQPVGKDAKGTWQDQEVYQLAREVVASGRWRLQTGVRGWPAGLQGACSHLPSLANVRPLALPAPWHCPPGQVRASEDFPWQTSAPWHCPPGQVRTFPGKRPPGLWGRAVPGELVEGACPELVEGEMAFEGWLACLPLETRSRGRLSARPDEKTGEQAGCVLGALLVGGQADKDVWDLDLLMAIGNQIGQALEKCRLYRQVRDRGEELTAMYKMAQAVNLSLDLDAILNNAMQRVGQIVPVEAGALLLLDSASEALTFARTVRDQDAFLISRAIQDERDVVKWVVRQGRTLILNDVQAKKFYSTFDQVTGFTTRTLLCVPLRVRDRVIGVIELLNKVGAPFDARDLELVSLMMATVAVAIENGRLFHDLAVAYDDLERSRQAILASRNRLQSLFDSILDVIYVVDVDYHITALNAALEQWLTTRCAEDTSATDHALADVCQGGQVRASEDFETEQVIGQICYQILYGRATPCQGCQMIETLRSGQRTQWTGHRKRADGLREEWEMSAYPIQGWRNGAQHAIVLARDVTAQRMLEASLSRSEKLASLGQLAAGLAHEINNPLTAIIANVQLLLMDIPPEDINYESIDLIRQASERAVKVVRNLLDFARQEQYEFQPTDINASLRATLELVKPQFVIAQVQVTEELTPNLPKALASRSHLQGVWLNLLLNARDAVSECPEGDRHVWIGSCLREDGSLEISVRDNGIGMTAEQLDHLFEPFFTTKDPGKGTGLGLSTSYRIVKQHGGEIQIDSEFGEGTTFKVSLPLPAG